jgi:hypothetical protein
VRKELWTATTFHGGEQEKDCEQGLKHYIKLQEWQSFLSVSYDNLEKTKYIYQVCVRF